MRCWVMPLWLLLCARGPKVRGRFNPNENTLGSRFHLLQFVFEFDSETRSCANFKRIVDQPVWRLPCLWWVLFMPAKDKKKLRRHSAASARTSLSSLFPTRLGSECLCYGILWVSSEQGLDAVGSFDVWTKYPQPVKVWLAEQVLVYLFWLTDHVHCHLLMSSCSNSCGTREMESSTDAA